MRFFTFLSLLSYAANAVFMSEKEIQELVRDEKRRYAREWRAKNKDKVSANNRRYWERKALARKAAEQEAK